MTNWHDTMVDRPETDGAVYGHWLDNLRPRRARDGCCGLGSRDLDPTKAMWL